ncbi:MAG TPA: hypothetical protein ENJ52_11030 [Aliiroseovarius sp.]|nr:hypothetical protein [Aliiroseovarius sp.]
METDQRQTESTVAGPAEKREGLRLIVALFFMGLAMRLLPDMGGLGLFGAVLPDPIAPHAYAIFVFTAAWFILAGQRLPYAAAFLIAFTVFSHAFVPPEAAEFSTLREAVLVTSLLLVGGFFDKEPERTSNPGRIRLVRVDKGRARRPDKAKAPRPAAPETADATHPFAPIPEEMDILFDQIAVTR